MSFLKSPKKRSNLHSTLRSAALLLIAAVFVSQTTASAITPAERLDKIYKDISYIEGKCPTFQLASIVKDVDPNKAYQDANARIIIGIAKTYNLDRQGALIGIMTGLAESNLRNLANDGTFTDKKNGNRQPYINSQLGPISLSLPHDDVGNDHDSVGMMQQRPSTGWSTYGTGFSREAIGQLMNPAYAAQAFFGTPPGAALPEGLGLESALKKGLQNLPGGWEVWKNKDPGEAAQAVQISAFPKAYNDRKHQAQSMLERLWDTSPAISLPVQFTGGSVSLASGNICGTNVNLSSLAEGILAYAWPEYRSPKCLLPRCSGIEQARYATTRKAEYIGAIEKANKTGGYTGWNRSGIDCGAFITRLMIDTGTDTKYNYREGNTTGQLAYLREQAAIGRYRLVDKGTDGKPVDGSEDLLLGDIAIKDGHTYIFAGKLTYKDPDSGQMKPFGGNAASASGSGDPLSGVDRAPMASPAYDFKGFYWYRLNTAEVQI